MEEVPIRSYPWECRGVELPRNTSSCYPLGWSSVILSRWIIGVPVRWVELYNELDVNCCLNTMRRERRERGV